MYTDLSCPRAGPRSDRERLENLHPHFNIRMGRELGGAPDTHLAHWRSLKSCRVHGPRGR